MRNILLSLFILTSFSLFAKNVQSTPTVPDTLYNYNDLPYMQMLDSLVKYRFYSDPENKTYFTQAEAYQSIRNNEIDINDSIIKLRIEEMRITMPFDFVYNEMVVTQIIQNLTKRKWHIAIMMGMADMYYPMFEENLDKYGLPLELKHLAVVESALNPSVRSYAGAAGLWQFMLNTGKMYDLNVTSYIDDRCDPIKSTDAACRHLKDLYAIYGDWSIVIAAYNAGPGTVNRAIKRANLGENEILTYWRIRNFLPRETQKYIPHFMAAAYVMTYGEEYGLLAVKPVISEYEIDTISITKPLRFDQISDFLCIPIEDIELLNPSYIKKYIPATKNKPCILRLPIDYMNQFVLYENAIFEYKSEEEIEKDKLLADGDYVPQNYQVSYTNPGGKNGYHIVQSGESLGLIANKYSCSVSQLKSWNGLYGTLINPGQKLIIYGNNAPSASNKTTVNTQVVKTEPKKYDKYVWYIVRNGDNLWDISTQFNGSTVEEIRRLNKMNSNNLTIGQKLKIGIIN